MSSFDTFRRLYPQQALFVEASDPLPLKACKPVIHPKEDVVVLYGLDDGSLYHSLLPWLEENPKRHLLYIEKEPGKLKSFLESKESEAFLLNPRVSLELFFSPLLLQAISWRFLGCSYLILPLPGNEGEAFEAFKNDLLDTAIHKNDAMREYLDLGVAYYKNFFANLSFLLRSYFATDLFGYYQGKTAIIVGAGPSLSKQMPLLQSIGNRALLFGCGSAIYALMKRGVPPHFAVGIDPNRSLAERLKEIDLGDTPFLYRLRLHKEILPSLKGPLFYVSGAGGYETAELFEKRLEIPSSEIDEGHNVIHFATEIAKAFGVRRIIYVGLDLGFTEDKLYTEEIAPTLLEEATIMRRDIDGKPLKTLWKWVKESKWLEAFAKAHPEIELINATEGGLGFAGSKVMPLQEALPLFFGDSISPLPPLSHKIEPRHLMEVTRELYLSLRAAMQHLEALISSEKEALLHQVELEEEVAWEYYLETFNTFFAFKQMGAVEQMKKLQEEKERLLKFEELKKERYRFLLSVATLGEALINTNYQK